MRISVNKTDSGYRPDASKFTVMIDGVKLGGCITADEELGLAVCYVHDHKTGGMLWDPRDGGRMARDTIHGNIVIIPPKDVTNVR
jgi:hypothetical protein